MTNQDTTQLTNSMTATAIDTYKCVGYATSYKPPVEPPPHYKCLRPKRIIPFTQPSCSVSNSIIETLGAIYKLGISYGRPRKRNHSC